MNKYNMTWFLSITAAVLILMSATLPMICQAQPTSNIPAAAGHPESYNQWGLFGSLIFITVIFLSYLGWHTCQTMKTVDRAFDEIGRLRDSIDRLERSLQS